MKRKELAYSRALVPKKGRIYKKIIIGIIFIIIVSVLVLPNLSDKEEMENSTSDDVNFELNFMGNDITKEVGKDQMEIDYFEYLNSSITYPEIGVKEVDNKIKEIIMSLKNDFLLIYNDASKDKVKYAQYIDYESYVAPENKISVIFKEAQIVNDANVMFERAHIYLFDLETGETIKPNNLLSEGYIEYITRYLSDLFKTDEYKDKVFETYEQTLKDFEQKGYNIAFNNESILIYFDKYDVMPGMFGIVKIEIPYDALSDFLIINEEDKIEVPVIESKSGDTEVDENIRYTTAIVNVRERASINSKKLGTLKEGEAVHFISGDNEWAKIEYKEAEAYVNANYLSRKKLKHQAIEFNIKDRGIDPTKPMVALTFDDGPNPTSTPRILDVLENHNAVATFFDLGQLVNTYPEIVKREESLSCEIGNHTYSHANLILLSEEELIEEIKRSEAAFEKALGYTPQLLRPAYGNVNGFVKEVVDYPFIKWNVDSLDWKSKDKDKILEEIRKTKNYDGKIILMHSIYGATADATEVLVPELIEQGYQLVTVSELAYYKQKNIETGKVYTDF